MVVPIEKVFSMERSEVVSEYFVRRMTEILKKQGQIEPLQVRCTASGFEVFSEDPHGNDILEAAKRLGWPTVLITETTRYQP